MHRMNCIDDVFVRLVNGNSPSMITCNFGDIVSLKA